MIAGGVLPARLLRSEWAKLWSVRSTPLVLGLATVFGLGVGLLDVSSVVHGWSSMPAADRAAFDPVGDSFSGLEYAQLAFGVLGVLVGANEYTTGTIRASLRAVPARRKLFAAKAFVLICLVLVVGELSAFVAFLAGARVLHERHLDVALADPGVLRAVVCAGLYTTVVTVVGFGLGAVLRHTTAATAALFAVAFLAWPLARAVEGVSYLPDRWVLVNAGDALATVSAAVGPHAERIPSRPSAALVLLVYVLLSLGCGAWRSGRDV